MLRSPAKPIPSLSATLWKGKLTSKYEARIVLGPRAITVQFVVSLSASAPLFLVHSWVHCCLCEIQSTKHPGPSLCKLWRFIWGVQEYHEKRQDWGTASSTNLWYWHHDKYIFTTDWYEGYHDKYIFSLTEACTNIGTLCISLALTKSLEGLFTHSTSSCQMSSPSPGGPWAN